MAFLRHKAREYGQLALLFLGFLTGIGLVVTCGGGGGGGQQLPTSTAGTISFTTLDLGNVSSPGGTPVAIGVPPALDGVTNVQDALNRLNVVLSPELARVTDPLSSDFIMDADLPAFLRDPVTGVPITFSRRLAGLVRSSSLSGPIRADNAFLLSCMEPDPGAMPPIGSTDVPIVMRSFCRDPDITPMNTSPAPDGDEFGVVELFDGAPIGMGVNPPITNYGSNYADGSTLIRLDGSAGGQPRISVFGGVAGSRTERVGLSGTGDVTAAGTISGNALSATTTVTAGTNITAGGTVSGNAVSSTTTVTAGTDVNAGNDVNATNDVTAGGNVSGNTVSATTTVAAGTDVTAGGNVTATGNVNGTNLNASMNVTAGGVVAGNAVSSTTTVAAGTDVTAGGNVTATGNVSGNDVNATNNVNAGVNVTAVGNVSAGATVSGTDVSATNNVTAGATVSGTDVSATNDVTAGNDVTATNNVTAGGTLSGNALSATTTVTAGTDLVAGNDVTAVNDVVAGFGGATPTTLDGATGDINAGNDVNAANDVNATGTVTGNAVSATTTVSAGTDVNATGNVVAGNGGATPVTLDGATGNVNASNDVTAGNDVTATGTVSGNAVSSTTTVAATTDVTAGGNVTAVGNVVAGSGGATPVTLDGATGNINATNNITAGGVLSGNSISSTTTVAATTDLTAGGNVVAGSGGATPITLDGSTGSIGATGNSTAAGNVVAGSGGATPITLDGSNGNITATGNVSAVNFTASGNVGAVNVNASGDVTATNDVVSTDGAVAVETPGASNRVFEATADGNGDGQVTVFNNAGAKMLVQIGHDPLGAANTGDGLVEVYDDSGAATIRLEGSTGDVQGVTKNFVQPHPTDPNLMIKYACLEGDENGLYARGTARLENGYVRIVLPESFTLAASTEGLSVHLTPMDDCAGLFAPRAELTREGFVVRELFNGRSNAEFSWMVNGLRRGMEDYQAIVPNTAFRPTIKGEPFMKQHPGLQRVMIQSGLLNADGTPSEASAQQRGDELMTRQEMKARMEQERLRRRK
ncbi:MAG: hypothetical protein H6807_12175 [Planctomycetes bacterium]|nr:hypothetical protein [Planctomycetota bacterium]